MAAARNPYEELARQLSAIGAVKRGLGRMLPHECPAGAAAVLTLLERHGEMRMSRLAELLAIDMSVTSRHVAHVAEQAEHVSLRGSCRSGRLPAVFFDFHHHGVFNHIAESAVRRGQSEAPSSNGSWAASCLSWSDLPSACPTRGRCVRQEHGRS